MPIAVDLVKRIRDVAAETHRQAESLELRADRAEEQAIEKNNDPDSAAGPMRENAHARRIDGQFLDDLATSIESDLEGTFDELAGDVL